jgi:CRP-like cAMP-binding protein
MRNQGVTLRSGTVLDMSPRTARLLTLAGVIGVILVVVGSLAGDRPETIEVDKIIHFSAYTTLAAVFVLSLRPRWCILALLGLALLSYGIELIQPLNMRALDVDDAIANTLGILVGAGLGLAMRYGYGYLKSELEAARIRRSLMAFPTGATLLRQGEIVDKLYVIRMGMVILYQERNGERIELGRLGPGEMFGLLAEILKMPQSVTVVAATPVQIYPIDYDELIEDVGGPRQPIGIVLTCMALELRKLGQTVADLRDQ